MCIFQFSKNPFCISDVIANDVIHGFHGNAMTSHRVAMVITINIRPADTMYVYMNKLCL